VRWSPGDPTGANAGLLKVPPTEKAARTSVGPIMPLTAWPTAFPIAGKKPRGRGAVDATTWTVAVPA